MNSILLSLALTCSAGIGASAGNLSTSGSHAIGATQSSFKLLHQPGRQSKPEGDVWGQFEIQIPTSLQIQEADAPKNWRTTASKVIGTAFVSDADDHRASIGPILQPIPGQTSYHFSLYRGYAWHWNHPRLELEIEGQPTVVIKLRDLPDKENVNLSESSTSSEFTCEAVPDLQKAGIFGSGFPKPGPAVPGFVITPAHPFNLAPGETLQAVLSATDSAAGMVGEMLNSTDESSDKAGSFYLPYRFAEGTKVVRVAFRRVKKGTESFEVEVPGCRLVSRFGGTGFDLDHDVTIRAANGWTVSVPRQYSGPFRDVKRDGKRIDIRCEAIPPAIVPSTGTYDDQAFVFTRKLDIDPFARNWGISLVSPSPSDLGLASVQMHGNIFAGPGTDAPVKYGEFTMRLKVAALVTRELSLDGYTIKVSAPSNR